MRASKKTYETAVEDHVSFVKFFGPIRLQEFWPHSATAVVPEGLVGDPLGRHPLTEAKANNYACLHASNHPWHQ